MNTTVYGVFSNQDEPWKTVLLDRCAWPDVFVNDLTQAITYGIIWEETPEKFDFWNDVVVKLSSGGSLSDIQPPTSDRRGNDPSVIKSMDTSTNEK